MGLAHLPPCTYCSLCQQHLSALCPPVTLKQESFSPLPILGSSAVTAVRNRAVPALWVPEWASGLLDSSHLCRRKGKVGGAGPETTRQWPTSRSWGGVTSSPSGWSDTLRAVWEVCSHGEMRACAPAGRARQGLRGRCVLSLVPEQLPCPTPTLKGPWEAPSLQDTGLREHKNGSLFWSQAEPFKHTSPHGGTQRSKCI